MIYVTKGADLGKMPETFAQLARQNSRFQTVSIRLYLKR